MIRVVTIGGGGGHSQVLKGLKAVEDIQITGICPNTDSGGSTGTLIDDYGAGGYLGDLTRCIAALCPDAQLSEALLYRYPRGGLYGHSVKNILLLALEKIAGPTAGLAAMAKVCNIAPHKVIPVTREHTKLYAKLKIGNNIESETNIDNLAQNPLWHPNPHAIKDIRLKPPVAASVEVKRAIGKADWVVICPGDFYTSIMPTLLPKGMRESLVKTEARLILVLNIVNKRGETDRYSAEDYVGRIEKQIGKRVDVILANSQNIPAKARATYALEAKITFRSPHKAKDPRVRIQPFVEVTSDNTVVHNPLKLTKVFREIFAST